MPARPIVILAPVLSRPQNAHPLVRSLNASSDLARLVFICSKGDDAEITACRATGVDVLVTDWEPGQGDWAKKLELGRHESDEEFMLLAADDLRFHPGWAEAVLDTFAHWDVGLVGTDDLANPSVRAGLYSTHPVICRGYADSYGTIDDSALMLHDGYWHNYVDSELVETARSRGCWQFAREARVEHLHPFWRTAEKDATYDLGEAHKRDDARLFAQRRQLWATPGAHPRNHALSR